MPKRSNDFQRLIAFIEGQLAPQGARVRESVMLPKLNGHKEAEVDVLVEANLGPHTLRVALECRDHSRPATVAWINELVGRCADLPIDRIVAVSRSGFTSGARNRAKGGKVDLFTLKEAKEAAWPGVFHGWRMAFVELAPKLVGVRLSYIGGNPGLTGNDLVDARIVDGSGMVVSSVRDDARELFEREGKKGLEEWWAKNAGALLKGPAQTTQQVTLSFTAKGRSVLGSDGLSYPIADFVLKVSCVVTVAEMSRRFYEYNGARIAEFTGAEDARAVSKFSLLLDGETGRPKSLNIRRKHGLGKAPA